MTHEDFNILLERRIGLTRAVLSAKATEYSDGQDRLHNFVCAAALLRDTVAKACLGMLVKHLVSVIDIVDSESDVTRSYLDEKIGDAINYLILLEAIIVEYDSINPVPVRI